jgi:type IV fimbrial biogenesis protein FimT
MDVKNHCPGQGVGWGNLIQQKHGVTLIELLMVLAILSIFALNAFPNLSALVAKERSTTLINALAGALAYARSEAILKHATVLTCQSNNGSECTRSENWHNGWIIFIDKNRNKQRDPEENLLRVYAAINNGTQATFRGSSGIKHYMKYKPTGQASPNGSFLICNPNIGVGKALVMYRSGRLRLSTKQTNGSAITCS